MMWEGLKGRRLDWGGGVWGDARDSKKDEEIPAKEGYESSEVCKARNAGPWSLSQRVRVPTKALPAPARSRSMPDPESSALQEQAQLEPVIGTHPLLGSPARVLLV